MCKFPVAEMDQNVLGTVDDSIDPNIFNFIDVGNTAVSPNLEDGVGFTWADDLISSAELNPSNSVGESNQHPTTVSATNLHHITTAVQQPLLHGTVLQHHSHQTSSQNVGGLQVLAVGQHSQQHAVLSGSGQHLNQTIIQGLGSQQINSPFILQTNAGGSTTIQVTQGNVSQAQMSANNATFNTTTQQFLPTSTGLVPLQSFVSNPTSQQGNLLQGHAVLAPHGSNIVHTQNALIQNPNVVNVNVAHVLPNHVNLQGTLIQTPQGKFLIQTPASGQQLQGQLNLSTLSNLGQVQMTGGVGLGQSLGQTAVMTQRSGNVTLNSTPHQHNFSLVNIGGTQGQILIQSSTPASANNVQSAGGTQMGQTNLILRTVTPTQQLLQQQHSSHLQTASSSGQTVNVATSQMPQQLVAQQGTTQNLQLQQIISGNGTQSLRLVGQPATTTSHSQGQATVSGNMLLQQVVTGNQQVSQVRLLGQQASQAGGKPGTVTLNLPNQNLNLQQLQNLRNIGSMHGLQISQTLGPAQQQYLVQQQQQQQQQQMSVSVPVSTVLASSSISGPSMNHLVVSNTTTGHSTNGGKKMKSKTLTSKCVNSGTTMYTDNILSQAMKTSGIEPEDMMDMFNGTLLSDDLAISETLPQPPTPPPPIASKSKKKKKKEPKDDEPVHPVVLSSTQEIPVVKSALSTASSTPVTTTISQATVSLPGHIMQSGGLSSNPITMSGQNFTLTSTTTSSELTFGIPTVVMTTSLTSSCTGTSTSSNNASLNCRGMKQGPPNVSIKPMIPNLQLTLAEKQQLLNIQTEIQRLHNKPVQTQAELAMLQQLDMQKKKIQHQLISAMKQQQQQSRLLPGMVGQSVVAQPHVSVASVQQHSQPQPQQLKLEVKPVISQIHVPGNVSAGSSNLQTSSNLSVPTKLKLLPTKLEPGPADSPTDIVQETKPLIMTGAGVTQTSVNGVLTSVSQSNTIHMAGGNVMVAVAGQSVDKRPVSGNASVPNQQNVLHVQFTQTANQAVTAQSAASQHVIVQSPQKVTLMTKTAPGSVVTGGKGASLVQTVSQVVPVTLSPTQARPVQIKIANQVMMLQLTPAQQEKLELHLSRMSMDQQQAFLRTQQHILAKLQMRMETVMHQNQVSGASGGDTDATSATVLAPTVIAAVSGVGGGSSKVQVVAAASTVTVTSQPQDNLPLTVQALKGSQDNIQTAENNQLTQSASIMKRLQLPEIPKASLIHQQLSKDQANAVAPDTKSPFKNNREACRRLLRYHVFQSPGPPSDAFEEAEEDFEALAEELVEKKDTMLAKYRLLLLQESMRGFPSSEMVFIQRMMNQDMHIVLRDEKKLMENDPDCFEPMPMRYLQHVEPTDDDEVEEEGLTKENDESDDGSSHEDEEDRIEGPDKDDEIITDNEGNNHHHDENQEGEEEVSDDILSTNTSNDNSFEMISPQKDEESVAKSSSTPPLSSPSPPPSVSAPVRLVIRNDGKGFTSRLASERRKSMALESGKQKMLHTAFDNKLQGEYIKRTTFPGTSPDGVEIKKEFKKECIEESYEKGFDRDKDKLNRTCLSVKLERLSEKTSHEYGLASVNQTFSSNTFRKRRMNETELCCINKKEQCFHESTSGDKHTVDTSLVTSHVDMTGDHTCTILGTQPSFRLCSPHNLSDDKEKTLREEINKDLCNGSRTILVNDNINSSYNGSATHRQSQTIGSCREMNRQTCSSPTNKTFSRPHTKSPSSGNSIHEHVGSKDSSSQSLETQSPFESIIDTKEELKPLHDQAKFSTPRRQPVHMVINSSMLSESRKSFEAPGFPGQIPADLIETEKMFNLGSDSELDGSFDLDIADPQTGMMNAQMQHAINSILNGSGESIENQGSVYLPLQHQTIQSLSDGQADFGQGANCDIQNSREEFCQDDGDNVLDESVKPFTHEPDVGRTDVTESQGLSVDDDLVAAVQSILM